MPQQFSNLARALLVGDITSGATSLTVESAKADLFPTANAGTNPVSHSNNWFKIVIQDATGYEIVYVRTRNSGSAVMSNLLRGQEGTAPRAFSSGATVSLRVTAEDVRGPVHMMSGATAIGNALLTAADAAAARTVLGATSTGSSLLTAADAAAARTVLGATSTGSSLLTAADAAAARTVLGATEIGASLITAASASVARSAIGLASASAATYTYDAQGRVASIDETLPSGTRTTAYTYDAQGRVTQAVQTLGSSTRTTNYAYDGNGNLTGFTVMES